MKLVRYNHPLRYTSPFDQIFNQAFGLRTSQGFHNGSLSTPATDLIEGEERFTLRVEVPGLAKEHLNLEINQDRLTLKANQASEDKTASSEIHYARTIQLPKGIDASGIKATLENGILKVDIPKSSEAQTRRIDIA